MSKKQIIEIKVILLGDSTVGKTCLLMKYMKKEINDFHVSTIGIEKHSDSIEIFNHKLTLTIVDTSGQERYRSITKNYYVHADGILLLYDITNRVSFNHIADWLKEIKEKAKENVCIYLIGNKNDLEDEREIQKEEGENFAHSNNLKFYEISSKFDKNLRSIFIDISENICKENKIFEKEEISGVILNNSEKKKKGCLCPK